MARRAMPSRFASAASSVETVSVTSVRRPARAGLVEQEAVAGIGDARHAGGAGGEAGEKAADRHVRVHEVRPLGAEQVVQRNERAPLRGRRQAARHRHRSEAETLGADLVEQRAVGADADHLVAARADAAHQRQQEVAQGEVYVGDFYDFHRGRKRFFFEKKNQKTFINLGL